MSHVPIISLETKSSQKKSEELLVELASREEKKNKKLLANMYVMTITVEEDKQL